VKQDLAFVPVLEQVSVASADANPTVDVYGTLARMLPNAVRARPRRLKGALALPTVNPSCTVLCMGVPAAKRRVPAGFGPAGQSAASTTTIRARFSDRSPAVLSRKLGPGGGTAVLCAFHPSLSYFHQATPPRRGTLTESFPLTESLTCILLRARC
jgi:hypothetical protein